MLLGSTVSIERICGGFALDLPGPYRMHLRPALVTMGLFLLSIAALIGIVASDHIDFGVIPTPTYFTGCFTIYRSFAYFCAVPGKFIIGSIVVSNSAAGLLFELWLLVMMLYRTIKYSKVGGKRPIMGILLYDALLCFTM